jgi:hypothetical protein
MKLLTNIPLAALLASLSLSAPLTAQEGEFPQTISYQGRVSVDGQPFTGTGDFCFLILSKDDDPQTEDVALWSNESNNPDDTSRPANVSIRMVVRDGLYSTALGGGGMPALVADDFRNSRTYLRVWFSDGESGFEQLTPDVRLHATPYAMVAQALIGHDSVASGRYSTAMGDDTTASGESSTTMGNGTTASGINSTAMGDRSEATGANSSAMGTGPEASGDHSTAMGLFTDASGLGSIAMGRYTHARSAAEVTLGTYTTDYTPNSTTAFDPDDRLLVAGNGTSTINRSDALILYKDGHLHTLAEPSSTNGNFPRNYAVLFENENEGGDTLALRAAREEPDTGTNFLGFFNGSDEIIGEIQGDGGGGIELVSAGADYAEFMAPLDPAETFRPGDVVAVRDGKITKEATAADQWMVISTQPILTGNRPAGGAERDHGWQKVAFIGQVPVRVRGKVASGDFLLASGDGSAVARTPDTLLLKDRARIIGRAWESSTEVGSKRIVAAVGLDQGEALVGEIRRLRAALAEQRTHFTALEARLENLEENSKSTTIPVSTSAR